MTAHTRWIICGLSLLASVAGCGGCGRGAVESLPAVTNPAVDVLAAPPQVDKSGMDQLSRVDMQQLATAADRYCQALAKLGCRVSVTLNFSYSNVSDADVARLAFLEAMDTINLGNTSVGDDAVAELANVAGLRSVMLGFTKVGDRSISYLQQLPRLAQVDLMNTQVTPQAQGPLMAVVEARISEGQRPHEAPPGWVFDVAAAEAAKSAAGDMDRYAEAVAKFGGTVDVQLDFSRLPMTDANASSIPLAQCVRGIDLSYTQVTDQSMSHLRKEAAALERIALVNTAVSETGVKELIEMPNLCQANLEGVNIPFPVRMELVRALTPRLSAKANRRGR